ncbi:hypothetical protein KJ840_00895 [Patescibacteria group bacterium]|nr:hypothetical protein [Patescibacteria group bacterium]
MDGFIKQICGWIIIIFAVVGFATFLNKINKPITDWLNKKMLGQNMNFIKGCGVIVLFIIFCIICGFAGEYIRNY